MESTVIYGINIFSNIPCKLKVEDSEILSLNYYYFFYFFYFFYFYNVGSDINPVWRTSFFFFFFFIFLLLLLLRLPPSSSSSQLGAK
jgi:hypothetical protein